MCSPVQEIPGSRASGMLQPRMGWSDTTNFQKDALQMSQFQIEGEADLFDAAEEIDIQGEVSCYSFVTAEKSALDYKTVIIKPVALSALSDFDGLLYQIDFDEEEDLVILREVQMFFWPWEDDDYEDGDSPDDAGEIA